MSPKGSLVSNKVGFWETGWAELVDKGDEWNGDTGMIETGYNEQASKYREHNKSHSWRRQLQIWKEKRQVKLWYSTGTGNASMNSWVLQVDGITYKAIGAYAFTVNIHLI